MYETKPYFYGTGRRKNSVARVRVPEPSLILSVD